MLTNAKNKLEKIRDIWNYYIWKFAFCSKEIRFDYDLKTNYFGDILSYFNDTFPVLEEEHSSSDNFRENIGNAFSFLQTIYVQQDLIEELHFIFKTGIVKGHLKSDRNYFINREIRNETIGHPIRKIEVPKNLDLIKDNGNSLRCEKCGNTIDNIPKKQVLLSSILISNDFNSKTIRYNKYHRDNDFRSEKIEHSRIEILERHTVFLETNFDKLIFKIKKILKKFLKRIKKIYNYRKDIPFKDLLILLNHTYENIFKEDFLFEPKKLLIIHEKRKLHPRYQSVIDSFENLLGEYLLETIINVEFLIEDKDKHSNPNYFQDYSASIRLTFPDRNNNGMSGRHSYSLSKLLNRENYFIVEMNLNSLSDKLNGNELALEEINNMRLNVVDDIEYYSSLNYLRKILDEG